MQRENKDLRRANAILKDASMCFRDRTRRSNQEVVRYFGDRKDRWGAEPICRALQFAPFPHYAAASRVPSLRQLSDEALRPKILHVYHSGGDGVYGAKKVRKQLKREEIIMANCTYAE